MEIKGEYRIPAKREVVWRALNDPEILKQTIPGCDELTKISDTEMMGKVTAKVGPVSAKFSGKVTLSDINPPESYKIFGEGQGGVAGFAKGGATVHLAENGNETVLTYVADAQVGGKLAQIGSRLIQSTSTMMANQFFSKFAEVVASSAAPPPPGEAPMPPPRMDSSPPVETPTVAEPGVVVPPVSPATAQTASAAAPTPAGGIPQAVWIAGLVVIIAVVLAIFAWR
jgi:carbon monoxide dehydrogenase subunit G